MELNELIERVNAWLRGSDYDFEQALPLKLASELMQTEVSNEGQPDA